jgi:hypothetical protein
MKRATQNPGETTPVKVVSVMLKPETLSGVHKRMAKDGVSYVSDLVQILIVLWLSGRASKKLKAVSCDISEGPWPWRFTLKARADILDSAIKDAKSAGFAGMSDLVRFLLEAYGDGRIELCLRRGAE